MRRWLGPADAVLQQVAWWVAILAAARGAGGIAALAGSAVVAVHLAARAPERARVARTAIAAALYGFGADTLLAWKGLVSFAGGGTLSPAWMVALWAAFGVALTASLRASLRWRPIELAAAAAVVGPLAYEAGAGLGALSIADGARPILALVAAWVVGVLVIAIVARDDGVAPGSIETSAQGERRWAR